MNFNRSSSEHSLGSLTSQGSLSIGNLSHFSEITPQEAAASQPFVASAAELGREVTEQLRGLNLQTRQTPPRNIEIRRSPSLESASMASVNVSERSVSSLASMHTANMLLDAQSIQTQQFEPLPAINSNPSVSLNSWVQIQEGAGQDNGPIGSVYDSDSDSVSSLSMDAALIAGPRLPAGITRGNVDRQIQNWARFSLKRPE